MRARLTGKAALILGASRGIGAATAAAFAASGARVVLAARDVNKLEEIASDLRAQGADALAVTADLTDPQSIGAAVAFTERSFGRLDVAFNNAGINVPRASFAELADADFDRVVQTNLRGTFIAMKYEIKAMLRAGGGAIVNTASAATFKGMAGIAAYAASKHAIVGLTRSAALEYASAGIRVNAVAPGAVLTDMLRAGSGGSEEALARIAAGTPMKRIGSPEEIAQAVIWLACEESSYVTGMTLAVDGGYTLS
jgi:NAD(P)-dependent dehydrogenase (short-subunit alcohol dehydrogenase family)